ncbi:hypothetical protein [uncultured Sutterella sp.]|uniref:hypothetical protein n=1 Tax=uncultured Sutterella sp. TaxID=286133 RepID=UPI0026103D6D|nr:hypothetical protein [uncultured Sutterella sp.]
MNELVSAVTFLGVDDEVKALRIPLSAEVRKELSDILYNQYFTFVKLTKVEFTNIYKTEDSERFYIDGYDDPDKTIEVFDAILSGSNKDTLTKVDDLAECNALLTRIPQLPDLILIQRFTSYYFADRSKFLGLYDGDTVAHINSSAFAFPSSITGVYNKKTRELSFVSVQTIKSALPGFADYYVPEAKSEDIKKFLTNSFFDEESVKSFREDVPVQSGRLFMRLINKQQDLMTKMQKFQQFDAKLKMGCYKNGKIVISNDARRLNITLRILLGDVYEDDGDLYLSNSRRPLKPF